MATLTKTETLHTSLSLEEWKAMLREHVEEVEEFSIVAKLSAGGVVVRTLRAPKSEMPFFGMVGDKLQIAELRYTHNLTPYQPLLTMEYTSTDFNVATMRQPYSHGNLPVICVNAAKKHRQIIPVHSTAPAHTAIPRTTGAAPKTSSAVSTFPIE